MKKFLLIALGIVGAAGIYVSIMAARFEPTIAPGVKVGPVDVSGMNAETAKKRVKEWWQARQMDLVTFTTKHLPQPPSPMKPFETGAHLDVDASIAQIPSDTFVESISRSVGLSGVASKTYPLVWTFDDTKLAKIKEFVDRTKPKPRPAELKWDGKKVTYIPEATSMTLDVERYKELAKTAAETEAPIELPMIEAPKSISDEVLRSIKYPIGSYTTSFPNNRNRVQNITVASQKINGKILMPGDVFSYNETVGQRTVEAGFKEAPVIVNGKKEPGVGGGICQVSTTLYNAALLGDLKIVERTNHSMPVAYVPVGRDATVNWGTTDLKFKNSYDFPIAVVATQKPGQITMTILGAQKQDGLEVTIERSSVRYGGTRSETHYDSSLPAGRTVVEHGGSPARTVSTWRVVKRNGKVVRRESLGTSYYTGGMRIVRIGRGAVAKKSTPKAPAAGGTAAPPAVTPPVAPDPGL
ncbi:MAG: VanW family protein [Armatimonadetes bacterium]|nr:VanW family protein [Armatimonadota bacterium]